MREGHKSSLLVGILLLSQVVLLTPVTANVTVLEQFAAGASSIDVTLVGNTTSKDAGIDVPRNVTFQNAIFHVEYESVDSSPGKVWLDIAEDDLIEWEFNGTGYGDIGKQSLFSSGSNRSSTTLQGTANLAPLLIPTDSTLQSSLLNASFSPRLGGDLLQVGDVYAIEAADVDGDGDGEGLIVRRNATYGFGDAIALVDWNASNGLSNSSWVDSCANTSSISTGDVDGDGNLDLMAFSAQSGQACIHLYDSANATFANMTNHSLPMMSAEGGLGDMNGDGHADIVSAHASGDLSVRLWSSTSSTFNSAITGQVSANNTPMPATLSNLFIGKWFSSNQIGVLVRDTDSHFTYWFLHNGAWSGGTTSFDHLMSNVHAHDLDADGDLDLVGSTETGYALAINDGTQWNVSKTGTIVDMMNATIADFDGDGTLNMITPISVGLDGNPSTFQGSMDHRTINSTEIGSTSMQSLQPWTGPTDIACIDMDGDGVLEQLVAAGEGNSMGLFVGGWHSFSIDANSDGSSDFSASGYAGNGVNGLDPLVARDESDIVRDAFSPLLTSSPTIIDSYGVKMSMITMNGTSTGNGSIELHDMLIGYDASFIIDANPNPSGNLTNVLNQNMQLGVGNFLLDLPFNSTKAGVISVSSLMAEHVPGAISLASPPDPLLSLSGANSTQVEIVWQDITEFGEDLVEFEVFRTLEGGPFDLNNPYTVTMINMSTDTSVAHGATYDYAVRSVHSFGVTSNLSQRLTVSIPYPTPPETVSGLTAADVPSDLGGVISVTWQASNAEYLDHYSLWVSTNEITSVDGVMADVNLTDSSVNVSGLVDGTAYWVAVAALDVYGNFTSPPTSFGPVHPRNDSERPASLTIDIVSDIEGLNVAEDFDVIVNASVMDAAYSGTEITLSISDGTSELANLTGVTDDNGSWLAIDGENLSEVIGNASHNYGTMTFVATMNSSAGDALTQPISAASTTSLAYSVVKASWSATTPIVEGEFITIEMSTHPQHMTHLTGLTVNWQTDSNSGTTTIGNDGQAVLGIPGSGNVEFSIQAGSWLILSPETLTVVIQADSGNGGGQNQTGGENNTDITQYQVDPVSVTCPLVEFADNETVWESFSCNLINENDAPVIVDASITLTTQSLEMSVVGSPFTIAANDSQTFSVQVTQVNFSAGDSASFTVHTGTIHADSNVLGQVTSKNTFTVSMDEIEVVEKPEPTPTNTTSDSTESSFDPMKMIGIVGGVIGVALLVLVVIQVVRNRDDEDEWSEDDFADDDFEVTSSIERSGDPLPIGLSLDELKSKGEDAYVEAPDRPDFELSEGEEEYEEETEKEYQEEYDEYQEYEEYEESTSEDDGITVDEDGCEWWEDEEGVWWYRTPEMEDWVIYEE